MVAAHLQDPDALWRDPHHDRNSPLAFGLGLALALQSGDLGGLLHDLALPSVWPPFHGILLGCILAVLGLSRRATRLRPIALQGLPRGRSPWLWRWAVRGLSAAGLQRDAGGAWGRAHGDGAVGRSPPALGPAGASAHPSLPREIQLMGDGSDGDRRPIPAPRLAGSPPAGPGGAASAIRAFSASPRWAGHRFCCRWILPGSWPGNPCGSPSSPPA